MSHTVTAAAITFLAWAFVSPTIAGALWRGTFAVFLAWGGVITPDQYTAFALGFHY